MWLATFCVRWLTLPGAVLTLLGTLIGALLLLTEGRFFNYVAFAARQSKVLLAAGVERLARRPRPQAEELAPTKGRTGRNHKPEPEAASEPPDIELDQVTKDLDEALGELSKDDEPLLPELDQDSSSKGEGKTSTPPPLVPAKDIGETLGASKGAADLRKGRIKLPPLALLNLDNEKATRKSQQEARKGAELLERAFKDFGVEAKVVGTVVGPTVTRYEVEPAPGVRVNRISQLDDDIQRVLQAVGVRIEAPVPGTSIVGVEVSNRNVATVTLGSVMDSPEFKRLSAKSPLAVAFGRDVAGAPIVGDLIQMPHLLVGGATYSGKSVCLNSIIMSLVMRNTPDEVQLVLIDPKRVELTLYQGLPHLYSPVIMTPKAAVAVLQQVMREMERRNVIFHKLKVRNLQEYNELAAASDPGEFENLPYLVVIVDELADLMMTAPGEFEPTVCRLAQLARATGIHLVLATQRPSAQIVTGAIKANIPARIAFKVAQQIESRIILDINGAERLRGRGDMLYYDGKTYPLRAQGALVTRAEVQKVLDYLKAQLAPTYSFEPSEEHEQNRKSPPTHEIQDEYFEAALRLVLERQEASVSILQRRFKIGWSRAGRLMDMMYRLGIVGPYEGSKPRQILVDCAELLAILDKEGLEGVKRHLSKDSPAADEGEEALFTLDAD